MTLLYRTVFPFPIESMKKLTITLKPPIFGEQSAVLEDIPVVILDKKEFPIRIEYKGNVYWLRETKGEKLILTK